MQSPLGEHPADAAGPDHRGEVRGAEVKEMLNAMNTGHPGSMSTLHANNPRDALIRLENMLMMGSGEMPLPALRRQIAGSVDLVIQVERLRSGHRCVTSATAIVGMEGEVVITEELWRRRPGARRRARVRMLGEAAPVDAAGGGDRQAGRVDGSVQDGSLEGRGGVGVGGSERQDAAAIPAGPVPRIAAIGRSGGGKAAKSRWGHRVRGVGGNRRRRGMKME